MPFPDPSPAGTEEVEPAPHDNYEAPAFANAYFGGTRPGDTPNLTPPPTTDQWARYEPTPGHVAEAQEMRDTVARLNEARQRLVSRYSVDDFAYSGRNPPIPSFQWHTHDEPRRPPPDPGYRRKARLQALMIDRELTRRRQDTRKWRFASSRPRDVRQYRRDYREQGGAIAAMISRKAWARLFTTYLDIYPPELHPQSAWTYRVLQRLPKGLPVVFHERAGRYLRKIDERTSRWTRPALYSEVVSMLGEDEVDKLFAHHLHLSKDDPLLVAFAPTYEALIADKYTTMKPGRYLAKFWGHLFNEAQIKAIAERHAVLYGPAMVYYVENDDPDGWEKVYEHPENFSSCMTYNHPSERYLKRGLCGKHHPVRAYARPGNGLRLAYLANQSHKDDGEFRVFARCIVREDGGQKGYLRVYGDGRLSRALEGEGYADLINLAGVELNILPNPDGICSTICPYLDAGDTDDGYYNTVQIEDDHLVIVRNGMGTNANGTLDDDDDDDDDDENHFDCDDCGDRTHEDEGHWTHTDRHVCDDCCNDHYDNAYVGWVTTLGGVRARHEALIHEDYRVHCRSDDSYYWEEALDEFDIVQDAEGDYWRAEDLTYVEYLEKYYLPDSVIGLNEDYYHDDDRYYPQDKSRQLADGSWVRDDDAICIEGEWVFEESCWQVTLWNGKKLPFRAPPERFNIDGDWWVAFADDKAGAQLLTKETIGPNAQAGPDLIPLRAYLLAHKHDYGDASAGIAGDGIRFVNIDDTSEHAFYSQEEYWAAVIDAMQTEQLAEAA